MHQQHHPPASWPPPAAGPPQPGGWQQQAPGYPPQPYRQPLVAFDGPTQQMYPVSPSRPRRRARRWIIAAVVVAVVLGGGIPIASALGIFGTALDPRAVERGVSTTLAQGYGVTASKVTCPSGQEVVKGHTFTCTATIDGAPKTVKITVEDETGLYIVALPQ